MAPEPFVPVVLTPAKLITVIEAGASPDSVAVMDTSLRGAAANARHISAVPAWTPVRLTSTQVNPPPDTPATITCPMCILPPVRAPVEINARINSLAEAVDNADTTILLLEVERSTDSVASIVINAGAAVAAKFGTVTRAPLTVTA
jgi:hypothetical protein